MTDEDRKALAEQILTNPLVEIIISEIERAAMEKGVFAHSNDHETRASAMAEVRAARAFRNALEAALQDKPTGKGAPA